MSWTPAVDRGHNEVIKIKFSAKDCGMCPARARCTEAKRRSITIRPREQYEALQAARSRESSARGGIRVGTSSGKNFAHCFHKTRDAAAKFARPENNQKPLNRL